MLISHQCVSLLINLNPTVLRNVFLTCDWLLFPALTEYILSSPTFIYISTKLGTDPRPLPLYFPPLNPFLTYYIQYDMLFCQFGCWLYVHFFCRNIKKVNINKGEKDNWEALICCLFYCCTSVCSPCFCNCRPIVLNPYSYICPQAVPVSYTRHNEDVNFHCHNQSGIFLYIKTDPV